MRKLRLARTGVVLALGLLGPSCAGRAGVPATSPAPVHGRYLEAGEVVVTDTADLFAIYDVVLRSYRPPPGQSRRLDRVRLEARPGEPADSLPAELATDLVGSQPMRHFCLVTARAECRSEPGGRLQLSPVYRTASGEARAIVRFHPEYGGPGSPSDQHFLLERSGRSWRVVERSAPRS